MVRIHTDSQMTGDMCYDLIVHGTNQISYSTPKQIKASKQKEDTRWHSNKKKVCTATKGEHNYSIKEEEYLFNKLWAYQWRCKCGKKGKKEYVDKPNWLK